MTVDTVGDIDTTPVDANLATDDAAADTTQAPIYRFVISGGPCGGKTTALARVFSFLRERGFEVMTCPEAFGLLVNNGMSLAYFAIDGMDVHMQGAVLDTQMALEDSVYRVLKARGKPSVILSDRGSMDGSVYISDDDFAKILKERQLDKVTLRDNRYVGRGL
jgi:predicted ATPase